MKLKSYTNTFRSINLRPVHNLGRGARRTTMMFRIARTPSQGHMVHYKHIVVTPQCTAPPHSSSAMPTKMIYVTH